MVMWWWRLTACTFLATVVCCRVNYYYCVEWRKLVCGIEAKMEFTHPKRAHTHGHAAFIVWVCYFLRIVIISLVNVRAARVECVRRSPQAASLPMILSKVCAAPRIVKMRTKICAQAMAIIIVCSVCIWRWLAEHPPTQPMAQWFSLVFLLCRFSIVGCFSARSIIILNHCTVSARTMESDINNKMDTNYAYPPVQFTPLDTRAYLFLWLQLLLCGLSIVDAAQSALQFRVIFSLSLSLSFLSTFRSISQH